MGSPSAATTRRRIRVPPSEYPGPPLGLKRRAGGGAARAAPNLLSLRLADLLLAPPKRQPRHARLRASRAPPRAAPRTAPAQRTAPAPCCLPRTRPPPSSARLGGRAVSRPRQPSRAPREGWRRRGAGRRFGRVRRRGPRCRRGRARRALAARGGAGTRALHAAACLRAFAAVAAFALASLTGARLCSFSATGGLLQRR